MSENRASQWALILGGSSGIGLATARKLGVEGYHICIVHRDVRSRLGPAEEAFEEIRKNGVEVVSFNADASSTNLDPLIDQVTEKIGKGGLKVLIHAISKGNLKTLVEPKEQNSQPPASDELTRHFHEIDQALKEHQKEVGIVSDADIQITNQSMSTSLIQWCRRMAQEGVFSAKGRVIALTSEGNKRIWNSYVTIAMAKSSLEILVKYLARELAPYDITANVIQAGITDTPSLRMIPGYEVIMASTVNRNPYKRLTLPEDVANFIYLMCQDEASWVNGAVIPVDGGEHFC